MIYNYLVSTSGSWQPGQLLERITAQRPSVNIKLEQIISVIQNTDILNSTLPLVALKSQRSKGNQWYYSPLPKSDPHSNPSVDTVLRSHTLRIPMTTKYHIINHLMFIDTSICSNWSNYIIRSETEQYNSSLRNLLIISRTMISLKNTSIRNSNFTIMLYSLLWRVVA